MQALQGRSVHPWSPGRCHFPCSSCSPLFAGSDLCCLEAVRAAGPMVGSPGLLQDHFLLLRQAQTEITPRTYQTELQACLEQRTWKCPKTNCSHPHCSPLLVPQIRQETTAASWGPGCDHVVAHSELQNNIHLLPPTKPISSHRWIQGSPSQPRGCLRKAQSLLTV